MNLSAPDRTVSAPPLIRAAEVRTLQLNITRLCNQRCRHCHIGASPYRDESMSDAVLDACVAAVERTPSIECVDITGGAPELHPRFRDLVEAVAAGGRRVIVRHNLTVAVDPHPVTGESMAWLPEFFARQGVELACSLPCYEAAEVDAQRGPGAFGKSIAELTRLNVLGYGVPDSGLVLDLVHNPTRASLPGAQHALEAEFRRELGDRHGVRFNDLFVIANMPIERFRADLIATGRLDAYLEQVRRVCDPSLADAVMCRTQVSVAPDGTLYDCDFNQALRLGLASGEPRTIFDFDGDALVGRVVTTAAHCLVCLSGEGSSCGGALRCAS